MGSGGRNNKLNDPKRWSRCPVLSSLVSQLVTYVTFCVHWRQFLRWLGLGCGLWPGSWISFWGKLTGPGDVLSLTPLASLMDRQPCHWYTSTPGYLPQPQPCRCICQLEIYQGTGCFKEKLRAFFLSFFKPLLSPVLFYVSGILALPRSDYM